MDLTGSRYSRNSPSNPDITEYLDRFRTSTVRNPAMLRGLVSEPSSSIQSNMLDRTGASPNHPTMNTPSREEFEAKLETIEARMDGRVASIEAKIDGLVGVLTERFKSMDERMGRMEGDFKETKAAVSTLKSTIIVTAISTALAIVLGVAAFNATVLSNMVASFESGKNTAAAQAEVKKHSEETAALLKQVQEQLDKSRNHTP